ncbi:MAG: PKD domain-containing protein [Candidatus Firestonebacteria bacterium]|nr:PKD domain-containing protein [Candidatus Firestonebacteria bacterium]
MFSKKFILILIFIKICLFLNYAFGNSSKNIPQELIPYTSNPYIGNPDMGLFSLGSVADISDTNNNILEKYPNNPYIVGYTMTSGGYLNWTFLEPEENEFNWTLLDNFVDTFKSYRKRYILEIYTAQGNWRNFSTPHWLYAKGATKLCAGSVWIRLGNTNYSPDVQPLKWSGYKNEFKISYNDPVGNGIPDIIQIDDLLNYGSTKVVTYKGREARSTDRANGQKYIYFNVDYAYINNPNGFQKYKNETTAKTVLTICYFDNGTDIITIEYDDINNPINGYTKAVMLYTNYFDFNKKTAVLSGIQKTNTLKWKTASFYIPPKNLRLENSKNNSYDIRITSTGSDDIVIDYLDITTNKPRDMEADVAPNWHDDIYFEYWKRFITKLNERYGQDTALDLLRITGFGRWDELSIATYGNKDWINILSGVYGINSTNKDDPLSEKKEINDEVSGTDDSWRWPRHENIIKKIIDFYNTTFSKPVELTVKVPFTTYRNYTSSLVELVNYSALKSNVIFNQALYNNEKTFSVEKYWESKIQTHEGAAVSTDLAFYGTDENSWELRFRDIYNDGWTDGIKKILSNHANYSYLYKVDTDIINYDSSLDNINPSEEKAIACEQGTKALRYLATHMGYHIESLEPEFSDIVSSRKKMNIKTKWRQKGNGKPYQNYRIFYALANPTNNLVIDLGAYYPALSTDKWYNNFKITDSTSANLLSNGSFEQDFSYWTTSTSNSPQIDNSASIDSTKSVYFKNNGTTSSSIQSNYIEIEPDTQYIISSWAKGINIQTGTNSWNRLYLTGRFYDSNKIELAYCDISFDTGTFDWSYNSAMRTSPYNAKYFRITNLGILNNGKGEAWIDKLVFEKYIKYSKIKNWEETDLPFYIENTQEISIPDSVPSSEYKLITGLITDKGYRIKLVNERDENGTKTPDDLFDDIYGMEYYQSEKSIYVDNIISNFKPELTAIEQKIILDEDSTIVINLKAFNPINDKLSFNIATQPINGILSEINQINDTTALITYSPKINFNGNDSFIYKVQNTFGIISIALISIKIEAKNDQPIISSDTTSYLINEGETLEFTINAEDIEGDTLNYSVFNLPIGATFNTKEHIFIWNPGYNQAGEYKITFEVTDGFLSDKKEITIIVLNVNQNPNVTISIEKNSEYAPLPITFTANAFDPDGNIVNYIWDFNDDGIFDTTMYSNKVTYVYKENGTYNAKVKVTDNDGASAENHIIIEVNKKNNNDNPNSNSNSKLKKTKKFCIITKILSTISIAEKTKYINRFRDAKLLNNVIGKKIVKTYYLKISLFGF